MLAHLRHYAKRLLGRPTVLPPVKGVANAEWYDAAYTVVETYHHPFWRSHYYFLWTVLADRLRRDRLRRVVDIGCGPGQLAACLFELAEIQSYAGLDFSPKAVELARTMTPQGQFHVGDATTTTLPRDTPHDVIICTEVLEHVPHDGAVVSRFPSGSRCLCTVPNFPYQSHVRHFTSAEEVRQRYGPYFERLDVWGLRGHNAPTHVYWLMDGVRNAHME